MVRLRDTAGRLQSAERDLRELRLVVGEYARSIHVSRSLLKFLPNHHPQGKVLILETLPILSLFCPHFVPILSLFCPYFVPILSLFYPYVIPL